MKRESRGDKRDFCHLLLALVVMLQLLQWYYYYTHILRDLLLLSLFLLLLLLFFINEYQDGSELDWDQMTVKGYCQNLEKQYLLIPFIFSFFFYVIYFITSLLRIIHIIDSKQIFKTYISTRSGNSEARTCFEKDNKNVKRKMARE